jgi:hypothetical protein
MPNLSSWHLEGYGCLTHVCTGVYNDSTSCAAVLDWFPLVAQTLWLSTGSLLCSFLGLFSPVHAQDVQIRSSAHRVLPTTLLLLEQYHNIILMLHRYRKNHYPQISSIKKNHPQNVSWGHRSFQLFLSPDQNSGEFCLIIHSDQTTKLISPAFLPRMVTLSQTHFSLWHLLNKGSCAKLYVILWQ